MLRLGLRRAGVQADWVNICDDRAAAAQVCAIAGADETLPAVVVGTRAMVNPSARQVVAAVRAGQPGRVSAQVANPASGLAGCPVSSCAAGLGEGARLTGPAGPRQAEGAAAPITQARPVRHTGPVNGPGEGEIMQVEVSPEAARLIGERGGRVWVWAARPRLCCGGTPAFMHAATERPPGLSGFRLVPQAGVEIWFRAPADRVPDVLEIGLHGRRRPQVEAYWDGCRFAL